MANNVISGTSMTGTSNLFLYRKNKGALVLGIGRNEEMKK